MGLEGVRMERQVSRECVQNFLLLFLSLLIAKFVKKSHIQARMYFSFLKNILKQTCISLKQSLDFSEKLGKAVTK